MHLNFHHPSLYFFHSDIKETDFAAAAKQLFFFQRNWTVSSAGINCFLNSVVWDSQEWHINAPSHSVNKCSLCCRICEQTAWSHTFSFWVSTQYSVISIAMCTSSSNICWKFMPDEALLGQIIKLLMSFYHLPFWHHFSLLKSKLLSQSVKILN